MIGKRTSEHGTTAIVNHAPRYTTLTTPRQLQSRGQVHNKRNNETVGFAKVFSLMTLEMRFRQSFLSPKFLSIRYCDTRYIDSLKVVTIPVSLSCIL